MVTFADSCSKGELEGVGAVGLVCWRTVEDGLSIFSPACVVWGL